MPEFNQSAGSGDPYWYEWSVGLLKIIDMLNPDNGIANVTFQSTAVSGWDDLVVRYESGRVDYFQIKHTRNEDSITFGDLVKKSERRSLLSYLAECWLQIPNKSDSRFIIYTNRSVSTRKASTETSTRPPLKEFFEILKSQAHEVSDLKEIKIPDEYQSAYQDEWLHELNSLTDDQKLQFYRQLYLETNQESLSDIGQKLIEKLSQIFGISLELAEDVLASLDHALRIWTTTLRNGQETINREDVYEKLKKPSSEFVGDHNLIPPFPFFNSRTAVIEELRRAVISGHKIIFLCGRPGVGKTSIISQLRNQRTPEIQLRYYTFKPISPDNDLLPADAGITATAKSLWGDLLSQLREYFKGKLSVYQVPIRNDFVPTVDKLREEVLRLAAELANITKRKTVICIDGIDHAARAAIDNENYLQSLIPPNHVPEEVVFVISGQRGDAYDKYPIWLKKASGDVHEIEIPNLLEDDISQLIKHSGVGHDLVQSTKLIMEHTDGNTLSVIYAIETLKRSDDLIAAKDEFEKNELRVGLNIYYENLWKNCKSLINYTPSLSLKIACIFSLSAARLSLNNFKFLIPGFDTADWSILLQRLSPIVIEDESGYRVLHNDVKVFLTKMISSGCEGIYPEIASRLIDLYFSDDIFIHQRHDELIKLLIKANNTTRILEILSPKFVLEAFISNSNQSIVEEQIKVGLDEAISKKSVDDLHEINSCIKSLSQLNNSILETNSRWIDYNIDQSLIIELKVVPQTDWNLALIEEVVESAIELLHAGYKDRAEGLLVRWFKGIGISDLLNLVPSESIKNLTEGFRGDRFKMFLENYGRIYYHTRIKLIEFGQNDEFIDHILANITKGILEEYQNTEGREIFLELQRIYPAFYYRQDMQNLLLYFFKREEWLNLYSLLKHLDVEDLDGGLQLYAMLATVFSKNKKLISKWFDPYKLKMFELANDETDGDSYKTKHQKIIIICFILAYTNIAEDPSKIVSTVKNEFPIKNHLDAEIMANKKILRISALIGRWFYEIQVDGKREDFYFMDVKQMRELTTDLLLSNLELIDGYYNFSDSVAFLVKLVIYCAEQSTAEYTLALSKTLMDFYILYPGYSKLYEIFWNFFLKNNSDEGCSLLLSSVIGDKGHIWEFNNFEKQEVINKVKYLIKGTKYQSDTELIEKKLKWLKIGFSTHKDYNLYDELDWIQPILRNEPQLWNTLGLRLFAVSNIADNTADNRASYKIHTLLMNSAMRSSLSEGYKFYRLIKTLSRADRSFVIDSIIDYSPDFTRSDNELKSLWLFGCGITYIHEYYDRNTIQKLKNKILSGSNSKSAMMNFMRETNNIEFNIEKYSGSDEGSPEIAIIPLEGDPIELLDTFIDESNDDWRYLKSILESILALNLHNSRDLMQKTFNYIINSKPVSAWRYGEIKEVFEILVPNLSDLDRWEFLRIMLQSFYEADGSGNLYSLAEAVEDFCVVLSKTDHLLLKRCFSRIIQMHEDWISGFGIQTLLPESIIVYEDASQLTIEYLDEFYLQVLFERLDSRSVIQIEKALSSIWQFAKLKPELLSFIVGQWGNFSDDQKEYLLMLFELVPIHLQSDFFRIASLLDTIYENGNLAHKLHALLVYKSQSRIDQTPVKPFDCKISSILKDKGNLIYPFNTIIETVNERPESKDNFIKHHHSLFNRRLDFLVNSRIKFDREYILEQISYLRTQKPLDEGTIPRPVLPSDIRVGTRAMDDLFNEVIEHILAMSNIDLSELTAIVQALMCNDDPQNLEHGYLSSHDIIDWSLIEKSFTNPEDLISELLSHGLAEEEIVIGGYVRVHTKDIALAGSFNTYFVVDENFPNYIESSTFNSRTAFLYERVRYYQPGNSLFTIAGGISKLISQNHYYVPSNQLLKESCWEVDQFNPFKLNKNGKEVVRLEKFMGPYNLYSYKFTEQTLMQRWICDKEAFEELKSRIDIRSFIKILLNKNK